MSDPRTLRSLVTPIESANPQQSPDTVFKYVDVSGVDNTTMTIREINELKGSDAPSRARRRIRTDDVIFATIRPGLCRLAIVPASLDGQICSTGYIVLRAKTDLVPRFLFYALQRDTFINEMKTLERGASYPAVSDQDVLNHALRIPPVSDQQRIVDILDEAFGYLTDVENMVQQFETAALDLFEKRSTEILAGNDGWEGRALGDVCTLQRGFDLPVQDRKSGPAPLISSSGPIACQAEAPIRAPGVVTGRSGSIGKVFWVEEGFWPLNTTLFVKNFHGNDPRFVFRLLKSFDLARFAGGAGVPTLNRNSVHGERVLIPTSLSEQKSVAAKLDLLESERDQMLASARRKLALLAELKQSILARAFSGELTREPLAA